MTARIATTRTRGRTWQRIRAQVLFDEPLCRACMACGRVTAAAEVDHIKPLHAGGTDARENLQSLCASCHADKSAAELGHERREVVGLDGWPADGGRVECTGLGRPAAAGRGGDAQDWCGRVLTGMLPQQTRSATFQGVRMRTRAGDGRG